MVLALALSGAGAFADETRFFDINIPSLNAAEALNRLAKQTGATLLFPYDLAKTRHGNAVSGRYTLRDALNRLLSGSGLTGGLSDNGVIRISVVGAGEQSGMEEADMKATGQATAKGNHKVSAFATIGAFLASLAGAPNATGQDTEAADAGSTRPAAAGLEEVIVTAERREASLQDVAVSVRSLGEDELKRIGADSMQDYAGFVPGLQLIQIGGGLTEINIRGVSTGDIRNDRPEIGETVGLYLDESPIASQIANPDMALLDLERIEVLRGPQATLYGAGSLAGTVRMISRKANMTEFEGNGSVEGSSTESGGGNVLVDGVVNVPLIENELALRGVGFYRDLSGFLDNIQLGIPNENDSQVIGGRIGLRYMPTEVFEANVHVLYQENDWGSRDQYVIEAGSLNRVMTTPGLANGELMVASLVGEYDFELATLTAATSYFSQEHFSQFDFGGITEFITGTDDNLTGDLLSLFDYEEFSQEVRLVSSGESNFTWIAGVFYQKKDHKYGQDLPIPTLDDILGVPSTVFGTEPDNSFHSDINNDTEQVAVYGEATLRVLDRWSFTAGLRWFDVEQDSRIFFGGVFAGPNFGTARGTHGESGVNPKVNVSFDIDEDRMIYAQAARGFRLGGVNQPVPQACLPDALEVGLSELPEAFDSDNLWNYEAGVKSSWLSNRVRLNVAGYYIDWETPPVTTDFPSCGFSTVVNAGSLDITGVEFDVEAALGEALTLRGGLSYTNSELAEDVPNVRGLKGDSTPYTPEFTANLSLDYDFALELAGVATEAFWHIDLRWTDERITNFPLNVGESGVYSLPAYGVGNARIGVIRAPWQVELFVDNLWNERPQIARASHLFLDVFPSDGLITTIRPRTFGIKVSYTY